MSGQPELRCKRSLRWAGRSSAGVVEEVPLGDYIGASVFPQRVAASLLSVLGAISLQLVAVGLYGVMAYAVSQRTHEIGIRMALGACLTDVLVMIVRQGMLLTALGLAAGIAGALAVTRLVAGMPVNVERDWLRQGGCGACGQNREANQGRVIQGGTRI